MRSVVVFFLIVFVFTGCGVLRDTDRIKTKTHTQVKEQGVRIVEIPKDSIVYVPNVIIKKKDTTVTVQNKSLILKTTYRNRRVKKITAVQKPVKEITQYERTEQKEEKVKEVKKEGFEIKAVYFVYTFLGLAFLIIINKLGNKI